MEEDPKFLTEQIVTYLGNKRSLLHFLGTGLEQVKKRLGKERLKAGEFDLIAVGRALLADAEWAEKIRHAREKEIHLFTKEDLKTLQ